MEESLKSLNSLQDGRILLCFPHLGVSRISQLSRISGRWKFFDKTPFPKDPVFPIPISSDFSSWISLCPTCAFIALSHLCARLSLPGLARSSPGPRPVLARSSPVLAQPSPVLVSSNPASLVWHSQWILLGSASGLFLKNLPKPVQERTRKIFSQDPLRKSRTTSPCLQAHVFPLGLLVWQWIYHPQSSRALDSLGGEPPCQGYANLLGS